MTACRGERRPNRRDLIRWLGAGAVLPFGACDAPPVIDGDIQPASSCVVNLQAIADRLVAASRTPGAGTDIFGELTALLIDGESLYTSYTALQVACAQTLGGSTDGVASWIAVVDAARALAGEYGLLDPRLPLYWAADRYKAVAEGATPPEPLDETLVPTPLDAVDAWIAAAEAWDIPAAEAALVGLYRSGGRPEATEQLWRYVCRHADGLGHNHFVPVRIVRALDLCNWNLPQDPLRVAARAVCGGTPGFGTERFEDSLDLVSDIRTRWWDSTADPAVSTDLLALLREADAATASATVADWLDAKKHAPSMWDGLALFAAELDLRHHASSDHGAWAQESFAALRHVFDTASDTDNQLLAVVQAAAIAVDFRDAALAAGSPVEVTVDGFAAIASTHPKEIHDARTLDPLDAVAKALGFLEGTGERLDLEQSWRDLLLEHFGDAAEPAWWMTTGLSRSAATDDAWRDRLLAALMVRGPTDADDDWARLEEAEASFDAIDTALDPDKGAG